VGDRWWETGARWGQPVRWELPDEWNPENEPGTLCRVLHGQGSLVGVRDISRDRQTESAAARIAALSVG
jgi:hypothetical protein